MAKFIFQMPDDLVALVEAYRILRGHKATAVSVRELLAVGLEVMGDSGVFRPDAQGRLARGEAGAR